MAVNWRPSVLLLVAACVDTIPLGHECPDRLSECLERPDERDAGEEDSPPTAQPAPSLDAGTSRPAPERDAAPPASATDAGVRSTSLPLQLGNPGFDVTRGTFGQLSYQAPDSQTPLGPSSAFPWVACSIMVSVIPTAFVEGRSGEESVMPTQGEGFIESVVSQTGQPTLRQPLERPLVPGQRYAFRIDVQTSTNANVELELWSAEARGSCTPQARLASTPRITAGRWQSVCVTFTPTSEVEEVVLVASPQGDADAGVGTRLFLDNLRSDPACR